MTPGEELVLKTLRQTTLAYLSENDFEIIKKSVEEDGILNLTGTAGRIIQTAVVKHASHDQSSHGSWAGGMGGKGGGGGKRGKKDPAQTSKKYQDQFSRLANEADTEDNYDSETIDDINAIDDAYREQDIDTLQDFRGGSKNVKIRNLARYALQDIKAREPKKKD